MRRDPKRLSGFYWVRFEGQVIVAEYTADGLGCSPERAHWHVPQSEGCHLDKEVYELLRGPLECLYDSSNRQQKALAEIREIITQSEMQCNHPPDDGGDSCDGDDCIFCAVLAVIDGPPVASNDPPTPETALASEGSRAVQHGPTTESGGTNV